MKVDHLLWLDGEFYKHELCYPLLSNLICIVLATIGFTYKFCSPVGNLEPLHALKLHGQPLATIHAGLQTTRVRCCQLDFQCISMSTLLECLQYGHGRLSIEIISTAKHCLINCKCQKSIYLGLLHNLTMHY